MNSFPSKKEFYKFIYESNSWADFENKIKSQTDKVKGYSFELLCICFLSTDPIYKSILKNIWHESECPDDIYFDKLNLLRPEIGVDIICEDFENQYWAVQCKYRSNHSDNLSYDDKVTSFFSVTERPKTKKNLSNRLLITTTKDISKRIYEVHDDFSCLNYSSFNDLDKSDFDKFRSILDKNYISKFSNEIFKPKQHQLEAIKNISKDLEINDRTQAIMACGSGKTLVALWVKEKLNCERVLVLLPSLNLLSQTIEEWFNQKNKDFRSICVCSDKSVTKRDKNIDNWVNNLTEIKIPVKNHVEDIKFFLNSSSPKVIFSTYQSTPLISEALKDLNNFSFDLAICDEAHRCAGQNSKTFSLILENKFINAKKRLFLTATPKEIDDHIKEKAIEKGNQVHSMDDPNKFGNRSHLLTFSDALNKYKPAILCDYKIIAIELYRNEINDIKTKILRRDYLSTDGINTIDAETLVSHISLAKAIKKYNLKKVITFHTRKDQALNFSNFFPEILNWMSIDQFDFKNLICEYIDGEMNTFTRKEKLKLLKENNPNKKVIFSNARCLQEGVDIKSLDGIAFIDPKRSFIDIVQAVGRVMRTSPGKEFGTIIIPVLLEDGDDKDQELLQSRYDQVWKIAKALSIHDDYLEEKISELRISLGQRKKPSKSRRGLITEKIIISERVKKVFADSIELIIARNTSDDWYERYGELLKYCEINKTSLVKTGANSRKENNNLGIWVSSQRISYKNNLISKKRIQLLEKLPDWEWVLSPDKKWDIKYQALEKFTKINGNARPKLGHELYNFVSGQRAKYQRGDLSIERAQALQKLKGWCWSKTDADWEDKFNMLVKFEEENGHIFVEKPSPLASWIANQRSRYKKNKVPEERIKKLESLKNWVWEGNFNDNAWIKNLEKLKLFVETNKHCKPSKSLCVGKFKGLDDWVERQRGSYRKKLLIQWKIDLLEKIEGWKWDGRI